MLSIDDEKTELEEYIDSLGGKAWKDLALAQYNKSSSEGKTHKEAINDVSDIIMEVANKTLRKIDDL